MTHQLSIKLTPVKRKVNIKVDPVESTLRRIHSLKVLLQVLPRQVRGEGDDFLDSYNQILARNHLVSGKRERLTRILSVLRTNIVITSIKNILIHQRSTRCHLPEKADLDWFSNLDPLSLLHEDLPSVFATIFTIEGGYTVLFWVVAFFERLEGSHKVMPTRNTVCDDTFGDTCCDGSFDDGGDGVHGTDDLGLELGWDVEFDLLEEVFGSTKSTDDEYVLFVR